jgi:hypothetical protein
MADHDVESVEAKKHRHATIERMAQRWREKVPFPRAHLAKCTGQGDPLVLRNFYGAASFAYRTRPTLPVWMAMLDLLETWKAVGLPRGPDG